MQRHLTASEKNKIKKAWEKWEPKEIHDLVDGFLWQCNVHGEDHDDQVRTARDLGLAIGNKSQGLDAFLKSLDEEFFADIEDDDEDEDEEEGEDEDDDDDALDFDDDDESEDGDDD